MAKKEYANYRDAAAKRGKEFTSGKSFKIVPGNNSFRILLPPKSKKAPLPWYEFQVHENVGPSKAYLRCGKDPITGQGDCYTCDKYIPKLRKRGKEERAAALEPKKKLVVMVEKVDVDTSKFVGIPQLWYPAKKTGETVVANIIGSRKRDYLSHEKGYNLSMTRTGTGQNDTRYGIIEADDEPTKVPSRITALLKSFDQNPDIPKYNETKMKQALGLVSADEDEEDEPKKKRRDRDEDEDEDSEDEDDESEDDDEEDDEDEKPSKKKKKSKSKKSKSDDDEEDDDDDSDDKEDEDDDDDDSDEGDDEDDSDEDDEDDDGDDEDDDEEDEDENPKKKSKSSKSKSVKKKKR